MRSFELEGVTLPNGVEISRGTEFLVREQVEYGSKSGECVFCPGEMFQVESLEWVDKQSPEWVGGDETGDVQINLEENAPVSSLELGDGTGHGFAGNICNGRFILATQ